MTSNSFNVNVLSQVQALDRKPAVSKEYADLKRRQNADARRKLGSDSRKKESNEKNREGRNDGDHLLAGDTGRKIDITV
jgi:hypothetical protein